MNKPASKANSIQYALGFLLLIVALNAFGGGYYGLSGAKNVPVEWLEGTPFSSYFIPSLFLFVGIGGLCLLAAISVFRRKRFARTLSIFCGVLILFWIMIQVLIIGPVSWLQPATAIAAVFILVFSWKMPTS